VKRLLLAAVALVGFHGPARAVPVMVKNLDLPGLGFNDPTPAAPVGGNPGMTLGQQRLNVFNRAAALWSAALVGAVPIEVDANFAALPCTGGETVLGHARPTTFVAEEIGLPANTWFAVTMANELVGRDLAPGESEIEATFNGGLAACTGGKQDWYYGFDGKNGDQNDLLHVVLHELGHGMGFLSLVNPTTGEIPEGRLDPFVVHVVDSASGQAWSAMTDAQRVASARGARSLAWDGMNVGRQLGQLLALGAPGIRTTPALPGLGGHLAEAEFGRYLAAGAVSGPLQVGSINTTTCAFEGTAPGAVVLIRQIVCAPIQQSFNAQQAGAVAVLMMDREDREPPLTVDTRPSYRAKYPVTIPVLAVTTRDAQLLASAAPGTTVQLAPEATVRVGADKAGRALLYASDPIEVTSTVSHWEVLARPNLLMEPYQSPDAVHDLRMELALFRDLGWATTCGNGTMDSGEACDQGAQNGATGATCRADCTIAGAGTGGMDAGSGGTGGGGQGGAPADASAGPADSGSAPVDAARVPDVAGAMADASAGMDGPVSGAGGTIGGMVSADAAPAMSTPPGGADPLVGGCACSVTGRTRTTGWGPLVLGLVLLLVRRETKTKTRTR